MNGIIHFNSTEGTTTLASAKISQYLLTQIPDSVLIDKPEKASHFIETPFDVLYVVKSIWAFCPFREAAEAIAKLAKKIVITENDFAVETPKAFRGYSAIFSSCDKGDGYKEGLDLEAKRYYVNWNQLTFRPTKNIGGLGLLYYGAFRKDREEVFRRYFPGLGNTLCISASVKSLPKFLGLAPYCRRSGPMDDVYASLSRFDATLYLQDETSGKEYHSPANRFYEALSCGVALFFDEAAVGTFEQAGYDIRPFTVTSAKDLRQRLPKAKEVAKAQRPWAKRGHLELLEGQLKSALGSLEA